LDLKNKETLSKNEFERSKSIDILNIDKYVNNEMKKEKQLLNLFDKNKIEHYKLNELKLKIKNVQHENEK